MFLLNSPIKKMIIGILFFLFIGGWTLSAYGVWGNMQPAEMRDGEWNFGGLAIGTEERPEEFIGGIVVGHRSLFSDTYNIEWGWRAQVIFALVRAYVGQVGLLVPFPVPIGGDVDIKKIIVEGKKSFPDVAADLQIGILNARGYYGASLIMSKRFGWFTLLGGLRGWHFGDNLYQGISAGYRIGGENFGIVTGFEWFSPKIDGYSMMGYGYIYVR